MFVNHETEMAFLSIILERKRPSSAQFVLLYGRRRVGKTVLLRYWAENLGEELSRRWVNKQGRAGQLSFEPEEVGSHWSHGMQDFGELRRAIDVVAVNWRQRAILLGECKWGEERVGRAPLRELIETKTPKVLTALPDTGTGWTVHYAFFARAGFTEAAQAEAEGHPVTLVDLERLDTDLREAQEEVSL